MKYTQKTKYFAFGALATAVLVPLAIYAVETIPVTFSEGDVISASVMNTVLKRVNNVQKGFDDVNFYDMLELYNEKTWISIKDAKLFSI